MDCAAPPYKTTKIFVCTLIQPSTKIHTRTLSVVPVPVPARINLMNLVFSCPGTWFLLELYSVFPVPVPLGYWHYEVFLYSLVLSVFPVPVPLGLKKYVYCLAPFGDLFLTSCPVRWYLAPRLSGTSMEPAGLVGPWLSSAAWLWLGRLLGMGCVGWFCPPTLLYSPMLWTQLRSQSDCDWLTDWTFIFLWVVLFFYLWFWFSFSRYYRVKVPSPYIWSSIVIRNYMCI